MKFKFVEQNRKIVEQNSNYCANVLAQLCRVSHNPSPLVLWYLFAGQKLRNTQYRRGPSNSTKTSLTCGGLSRSAWEAGVTEFMVPPSSAAHRQPASSIEQTKPHGQVSTQTFQCHFRPGGIFAALCLFPLCLCLSLSICVSSSLLSLSLSIYLSIFLSIPPSLSLSQYLCETFCLSIKIPITFIRLK